MEDQNTLQVIVYRKEKQGFKFLILKRIKEKGGFWQPITGRLEKKESPLEGSKRELKEEANITEIKKELKVWDFPNGQGKGREFVFAFEVDIKEPICIDCNVYKEHDDFKWCSFREAIRLTKFKQKKEALKKLKKILTNPTTL